MVTFSPAFCLNMIMLDIVSLLRSDSHFKSKENERVMYTYKEERKSNFKHLFSIMIDKYVNIIFVDFE